MANPSQETSIQRYFREEREREEERWNDLCSDAPQSTPTPKDLFTALRRETPDRLQVAALFFDRGVDINGILEKHRESRGPRLAGGSSEPRTKVTALYDAAQRGDYKAVEFLISRGADVMARNITGMGMLSGMQFPDKTIETLRALDGMRMSRNLRIVQLAEEMYEVETEEEFIKRRDAFDELMRPRYARSAEFDKSRQRRVKSVLPKKSAKESQKKKDQPDAAIGSDETRYGLRARKSALSYAES
jgi:hypothetical protein